MTTFDYIKTVNCNDEPVWAVKARDFCIYDPYTSECGRFAVSPSYYGLTDDQARDLVAKNETDGFDWKC